MLIGHFIRFARYPASHQTGHNQQLFNLTVNVSNKSLYIQYLDVYVVFITGTLMFFKQYVLFHN